MRDSHSVAKTAAQASTTPIQARIHAARWTVATVRTAFTTAYSMAIPSNTEQSFGRASDQSWTLSSEIGSSNAYAASGASTGVRSVRRPTDLQRSTHMAGTS